MKLKVDKGKTLLVDGPASISILSGSALVLGMKIKPGRTIVVKGGRRLPIEAVKSLVIEAQIGEGGSLNEVEGSTIPQSWLEVAEKIISCEKPATVVVMGGVDSGKSSLCTYLVNIALEKGLKVGIVDADLGQSDVGPPTTIGFGVAEKQMSDLTGAKVLDAYFVGTTSPRGVVEEVLRGVKAMKFRAENMKLDLLIVNTDGWIDGAEAEKYKRSLVEVLDPKIIVGVQREKELEHVLRSLSKWNVIQVEAPPMVKKRDRDRRKETRELAYRRYLQDAKIRAFPISWIKIEGETIKIGMPTPEERFKFICNILGFKPKHCEETNEALILILDEKDEIEEEKIKKLEEAVGKKVEVLREGEEKGLMVSLYDANRKFLGIGLIKTLDYKRRTIKIYTSVKDEISIVKVGWVKVDEDGHELGFFPSKSAYP